MTVEQAEALRQNVRSTVRTLLTRAREIRAEMRAKLARPDYMSEDRPYQLGNLKGYEDALRIAACLLLTDLRAGKRGEWV